MRTITALALAAMAEAAHPYGIESFDSVLRPLWKGIRSHRGKGLAAFLKAIGFIIPLMDSNYANYYTKEVSLSFRVVNIPLSVTAYMDMDRCMCVHRARVPDSRLSQHSCIRASTHPTSFCVCNAGGAHSGA